MKRLKTFGFTTALIASASACNPEYYVPTAVHVPMLQQKGDVSLAGHFGEFGVEFHSAYAAGNRTAIMLNAAGGRDGSNETVVGDQTFIEAGFGFFRPIPRERLIFENYALFGVGRISNVFRDTEFATDTGRIEATFVRFGIQPSLALYSAIIDVAFATRFSGLRYTNATGHLILRGDDQVAFLEDLDTQFLIEPAIVVRAGYDPVKVAIQYGLSRNMTNRNFPQTETMATVSVVYSPRRRR